MTRKHKTIRRTILHPAGEPVALVKTASSIPNFVWFVISWFSQLWIQFYRFVAFAKNRIPPPPTKLAATSP